MTITDTKKTSSTDVALQLTGIHHVSSLSARIAVSHNFFTDVLGLRLLLKTVNQDDVSMYHLFFGDGAGSPGSDMTIFDLPRAAQERRGNKSISRTTLRISGAAAMRYWAHRLASKGVSVKGPYERAGRQVLDFDDPVGTALSLVDDGGLGEAFPWQDSPVPAAHQIRGLGYVMITVAEREATERFLTGALGLRHTGSYKVSDEKGAEYWSRIYSMGAGGAAAEVHVAVRPDLERSHYGSGGVHHLALRLAPGNSIASWVERLNSLGYENRGVVDRHYFTSTYVREPGGVLFELATDGPGFEVDAPIDGERLSLPPFLEGRRGEIEAGLKPIVVEEQGQR